MRLTPSVKLDSLFQAFSNSKRRGMIYALSFRPATINQLASEFNLSLPAIHKHIKVLEQAKLIHRRKSGRTNFVALNRSALAIAQRWTGQFRTEWGNDEETLDNYIARMHDISLDIRRSYRPGDVK